MTREERARQIDAEEFRRESEQALQRALEYSKQKQDERRRDFLIKIYGEIGKTMLLYPKGSTPKPAPATSRTRRKPAAPVTRPRPSNSPTQEQLVCSASRRSHGSQTLSHNGLLLTRQGWADHIGVSYNTFCARLGNYGLTAAIEMGSTRHRGVGQNLPAPLGTGAGSTAQEIAEITFPKKAQTE